MGARYRVAGTTLRLADAATTEMGCDPARHDQDDWLFAFLGSSPTVALGGDRLTLRSGTTAITLLDREDIRSLGKDLDDILDSLEMVGQYLVLFARRRRTGHGPGR